MGAVAIALTGMAAAGDLVKGNIWLAPSVKGQRGQLAVMCGMTDLEMRNLVLTADSIGNITNTYAMAESDNCEFTPLHASFVLIMNPRRLRVVQV